MDRSNHPGGLPMKASQTVLGLTVLIAMLAEALPARAQDGLTHRWGVGLEVQPIALPNGHLGLPLGGDESAFHLAMALSLRYQIDAGSALEGGVGLAHPALGASMWFGYERLARLVADRRAIVALEMYATPGLQLGFAGPDEYARQSDVFVGYGYAFGGPPAFGFRFPVGLRVSFAQSRFDVYVAGVPEVIVTPTVEVLFQMTTGVRLRF
jgi:hypothetical protein